MSQVKKLDFENEEPILEKWLQEFKSYNTQRAYRTAIRKFKGVLGIGDLEKYLESNPDTEGDIRKFLQSLDGKPSKTVTCYTHVVKVFFQDHGVKVSEEAWNKIRRRGFMPKRVKAETRDKKPTKQMLKKILNYADLKARAQILFLTSSGARIGETLQLVKDDFDFKSDPPKVHIRAEITKGGVGERTVFFSYEARDAIQDWLKIKDTLTKRGGSKIEEDKDGNPLPRVSADFSGPRVFAWNSASARFMWNLACDKAGIGDRDKRTGRRIYHLHSLRKFFRTKIGLDLDVIHALMGHAEYLDASYLRLEEEGEIAKVYLEAMPNVSVYQVESPEVKSLEEENQLLKDRLSNLESEFKTLKSLIVEAVNGNKEVQKK